jgi:type I restriction enzyme S subunit
MSEWKEYRLSDVCNKIGSGATPRGGAESYQSTGEYSLIRSQNVLDYNFTMKGLAYINEAQASKLNNVEVKERDILLNITGDSVARVCQVPQSVLPARVNQHVAIIRPNSDYLTNEYLKYYLLEPSIKDYLLMLSSSGGTRNAITKSMIEELVIQAPDLPTQIAIAEILSSLDDKIELNNKINQELETLAQILFKQWFIDFEFPNENGAPYKSSGGEMVDSELGEIPKGWRVEKLKDEFVLNMGQSPSGDTYNTEKDGMIFFQGRSDFGFRFPSIRMYTNAPKKVAKRFETLISVRAPVGDVNMAADDCCIGRGLGSISHSNKLYTYTYYKILSLQAELKSYDNEGTVFGSINKETLGNIKTIIPPISLCEKFDNLFKDLDSKIYNLDLETQDLINSRDTLLPKLISGELEINEISN